MTETVSRPAVLTWRCFHCSELFSDESAAALHFGNSEGDYPVCKLAAEAGGLVELVRKQEADLDRYRQEDTKLIQEVWGLGAKSSTQIRQAEEEGYERGLADGRALPATDTAASGGLEGAVTLVEQWLENHQTHLNGLRNCNARHITSAQVEILERLLFALHALPDSGEVKRLRDLLRRIEPHLDAIVCYASTAGEYEPNAVARDIRQYLAGTKP